MRANLGNRCYDSRCSMRELWSALLETVPTTLSVVQEHRSVRTMKRVNIVGWLFLLASILTSAAGLIPLLRGRPMNLTFIVLGGVWLIMAIVSAAKERKHVNDAGERAQ